MRAAARLLLFLCAALLTGADVQSGARLAACRVGARLTLATRRMPQRACHRRPAVPTRRHAAQQQRQRTHVVRLVRLRSWVGRRRLLTCVARLQTPARRRCGSASEASALRSVPRRASVPRQGGCARADAARQELLHRQPCAHRRGAGRRQGAVLRLRRRRGHGAAVPGAQRARHAVGHSVLTRPAQLLPETRIRVSLTAEEGTRRQRATLRYASRPQRRARARATKALSLSSPALASKPFR